MERISLSGADFLGFLLILPALCFKRKYIFNFVDYLIIILVFASFWNVIPESCLNSVNDMCY